MKARNNTNGTEFYYQNINSSLDFILPLYAFVLLACLIGNIVVCVTILRDKVMRRRRWYFLLINLSVADVGFAFTTMSYILQLKSIDTGNTLLSFILPSLICHYPFIFPYSPLSFPASCFHFCRSFP